MQIFNLKSNDLYLFLYKQAINNRYATLSLLREAKATIELKLLPD